MQYFWRVFRWINGEKNVAGEYVNNDELTQYLNAPIYIEDRLDETLDSGEIMLKGMPVATKAAFPPKTKFRLERYTKADYSDTPKKWDMIVEHDDVEEYVGCPEICTHRVHLIEASAVAQGMHVDNIALTYELQDVTLNYRTTQSSADPLKIVTNKGYIHSGNKLAWKEISYDGASRAFFTAYEYKWDYSALEESVRSQYPGLIENEITVKVPKLKLYAYESQGTNSVELCCVNTRLHWECNKVKRNKVTGQEVDRKTIASGNYTIGPDRFSPVEGFNSPADSYNEPDGFRPDPHEYIAFYGWHRVFAYSGDGFNALESEGVPAQQMNADCAYLRVLRHSIYGGNVVQPTPNSASRFSINGDEPSIYTALPGDYFWYNFYWTERENPVAFIDTKRVDEFKITTPILTDKELADGYVLEYKIRAVPHERVRNGMISYIWCSHFDGTMSTAKSFSGKFLDFGEVRRYAIAEHSEPNFDDNNFASEVIAFEATFECGAFPAGDPVDFTKPGEKYNCYDLIRKAVSTVDTVLITDRDYYKELDAECRYSPIIFVHDNENEEDWAEKLRHTSMYETVFEGKNLWEVLLQTGYYLHAIPYLEFAEDGTDRFVVKYRQLGRTDESKKNSVGITVFNSRNLSDYFAQYDSYVSNLFSPQCVVEEWIVAKTEDDTYLVSNDTAVLLLTKGIYELLTFEVGLLDAKGDPVSYQDATKYVFEKSVYNLLPATFSCSPSKANSLFFELGSNKIQGLTYVPPEVNSGDNPTALKRLASALFGAELQNQGYSVKSLRYDKLIFHVRYRTYDELRIKQVRPDLTEFMKNSSFEQYPHHEQYYGQQDKIVDSERFAKNLYGQLIREGNAVYQIQELAVAGDEKEAGDLFSLAGEPYYVTEIDNEYYPDAILQKATYSKNWNQLSNIVTIPSEPRFYEVSEHNTIRREVLLPEFIKLSGRSPAANETGSPKFLPGNWEKLVSDILFKASGADELPNYAYVCFTSSALAGNHFPSVGLNGDVATGSDTTKAECIVPVLRFPMYNSLVCEWDMEDNFKAGDGVMQVLEAIGGKVTDAYFSLFSARYVDVMGRAEFFSFKLFRKDDWNSKEMRLLPAKPENVTINGSMGTNDGEYVVLNKDNREALSFNYQINLLWDHDFVIYPNIWGEKQSDLKAQIRSDVISNFDNDVDLFETREKDILENGLKVTAERGVITIEEPTYKSVQDLAPYTKADINSIVLYSEGGSVRSIYVARNVSGISDADKLKPWYIYCPAFKAGRG